MPHHYFVTGTDTDAGKTLIACGLLCAGVASGLQTMGLKPLAAGVDEVTEDGARNRDAVLLQRYSSVPLAYEQVNPVLLQEPMAPHIAAEREQRRLSVDRLQGFLRGALNARPNGQKADLCLIEGAGGWRVPLSSQHTMAHLAQAMGLPVILVVGMKLGCLNHALLTAEAIRGDGLPIAGWVATVIDPEMAVVEENLVTLKRLLPFPMLGFVPWLETPSPEAVALHLDIALLVG